MAQEAIQAAETGNFTEAQDLLKLVTDPFTTVGEDEVFAHALAAGGALTQDGQQGVAAETCKLVNKYGDGKPPAWATKLCVTCSS
ncbi:hypothetical protein DUNSADRAFT_16407 [Dunaliella salina]|uniref:Uncharacterized protein n=1 Tax=Dunaliella salina TaxID=3046 RepID=A0ABQ7G3M7_DUNSA|nr:hypothetical protein DUNSADRAFT_16407 [Dunaliella salina]|eukprot:KAF5829215.1 hypothetical protein DUNSADRAFT_16407 [Dunaliella salina]